MIRNGTIDGGLLARRAREGARIAGLTAGLALATLAALIFPPAAILALAILLAAAAAKAPRRRAVPKKFLMPLLYASAASLPLWPVYLHLKLGPAPILTPPRVLIYALTICWIYDMAVSPLRRGQFLTAMRRGALIAVPVTALWMLSLLSLPFAEGRLIAAQEFFRQTTIWLAPFLAVLTYVRRTRELRRVLALLAAAAGASGAVALIETASGHLLASALSPFVSDAGSWLEAAQTQKVRDGVFRAQGPHTHPLSLAEVLAAFAPIALGFAVAARRHATRLLWLFCLALIVGGVLATSSRGALVAIIFALGIASFILAGRVLQRESAFRWRPAAGLALMLMIVAAAPLGIAAHKMISGAAGESAARSTQSRIDQIEQAWPLIAERPLGGYGTGRAARVLGYWGATLTVDNYYLNLALDLGLPGPAALLAIFAGMALFAMRRARRAPPDIAPIFAGLASAALALAMCRMILSQTGNLAILYLLLGAMAGSAAAPRAQRALRR